MSRSPSISTTGSGATADHTTNDRSTNDRPPRRRTPRPRALRRHARISALSASTLLVGALATACAGNSGQSVSDGGVPTVTIGKAVDTVGFSAVDVAIAKGYFKDAGVNVKTELLQGSSQTNAALQGGSIQFATLSSNAQLLAASQGVKLQAIASLDYGASLQFVVSKNWMAQHHITPQQPLTQRIKGLKGAQDAAISSTGTQFLKLLLTESGVPTSSVKYVTVGSDAAGATALQHGTLQIFVGSPPSSYYIARKADATILASGSEVPEWKNMAYDLLTTTPSYAKKNPKTATAVATALARAENLMRTDPQSVLSLEAKHFPTYSSTDLLQSLKGVQWSPDGQFTQAMWNDALAVAKATGALGGSVDVSQGGIWTNQYINKSVAAKL